MGNPGFFRRDWHLSVFWSIINSLPVSCWQASGVICCMLIQYLKHVLFWVWTSDKCPHIFLAGGHFYLCFFFLTRLEAISFEFSLRGILMTAAVFWTVRNGTEEHFRGYLPPSGTDVRRCFPRLHLVCSSLSSSSACLSGDGRSMQTATPLWSVIKKHKCSAC